MAEKVGVDTAVLIYLFEQNKEYGARAERVFREIERGDVDAVLSSIGLIELFTGVKKRKRYDLLGQYKNLVTTFPHLTIMGIDERIVDTSSDLRAKYGITTPDAIHLATAIAFQADRFITNDKKLQRVEEIRVETL